MQDMPAVEPEIIPPNQWREPPPWRAQTFAQAANSQRIYVTRLGPFGSAMLLIAIGAIAAVLFLTFLGALLIWIPLIALAIAVAMLTGFFRPRRR
jgi:uncharacterized membrane protein YoaK (UPF0700 family)